MQPRASLALPSIPSVRFLTLAIITTDGFDDRVSNLHGALGAGNYFALSATHSDS